MGSSFKVSQADIKENGNQKSSRDPGYHSSDANCSIIAKLDEVEDHLDLSESYDNGQIKWGGAKARTSKRLRFEGMPSDAHARSHASLDGHDEKDNSAVGHVKSQRDCDISPFTEAQIYGNNMDGLPLTNGTNIGGITLEGINGEW